MDLANLLNQLRIPFKRQGEHRHASEGWLNVNCFLCSRNSGKFKLGFPIACPWSGSCWTCGRVTLINLLIDQGVPYKEAKTLTGGLDKGHWQKKEHPGKLVIPKGVGEFTKSHKRYLVNRGFDPDEIAKLWNVQGIGLANHLKWRLFIPLVWRGDTVSWTTRAISEDVPTRYVTAKPEEEKLPSKSLLYGMDYVRHSVIVVEGPTDVWRIGPGAVASFGTVFTKSQVLALSGVSKRIVCFDSDSAAQKRAKKLADLLSLYDGETLLVTIDAPDPGSMKPNEVKALRRLL